MSVVLIDVRPRDAYEAGHIPGAVHLDPESDLSAIGPDAAAGGRHPLPSDAHLEDVFARAGVGPASFVLALDDGTGWAARCWWLLRHLGHDAAGTFDVRSYLGPLSTAAPETPRGDLRARPRVGDTIAAEEILARLDDPGLALFDARSRVRWLGEEEPLDPVAGRIPGSFSAFFAEPLPAGATDAAEIVAYCGSGVTACVVAQKLVLAGREDVRVYPGSFSEWCRRESYPIEKGTP
jgi:thiosulfate/3-mercaptopyruvate sulfurtransferase